MKSIFPLSFLSLAFCLSCLIDVESLNSAEYSLDVPSIYQNPFMAQNNLSEIHNNAYQTDTISLAGPGRLKRSVAEGKLIGPIPFGIAGTMTFNSQGQIITIRSALASESELLFEILLLDPDSLEVISRTTLPAGVWTGSVSFGGGGYFYLDNLDRVVCITNTQQIRIYSLQANAFVLDQTYDLSTEINNSNDILNSTLPDNLGNLWFITQEAIVGYVDPTNGDIFTFKIKDSPSSNPNETNTKSFASDEDGGIFVVTDYALYRFQIGGGGSPEITWREEYDRGTRKKPGQNQQGSGTTPTLFNDFDGNQFVAIADNADPYMHVLVYNRNTGNLIAQQEVFRKLPKLNACENSLIALNHTIIIENNYGNQGTLAIIGPKTTRPGLTRIDFDPSTGESSIKWESLQIAIPSVVTQLSTTDGLIYTYAKDLKGWYWAAVEYESGRIVSTARIPRISNLLGPLANNFYAGINIGVDGTVYVSVFGGIVSWRAK